MKNKQKVVYDINSGIPLKLGFQEDVNAYEYELNGWSMYDKENILILNIATKNKRIPIVMNVATENQFKLNEVGLEITRYSGVLAAQFIEIEPKEQSLDELMKAIKYGEKMLYQGMHHSNTFLIELTGSIPLDGSFDVLPKSMEAQALLLIKLIESIKQSLEEGKFNGRDGVDGKDGKDGRDGLNGRDGRDAIPYDDTNLKKYVETKLELIQALEDRIKELENNKSSNGIFYVDVYDVSMELGEFISPSKSVSEMMEAYEEGKHVVLRRYTGMAQEDHVLNMLEAADGGSNFYEITEIGKLDMQWFLYEFGIEIPEKTAIINFVKSDRTYYIADISSLIMDVYLFIDTHELIPYGIDVEEQFGIPNQTVGLFFRTYKGLGNIYS